MNRNYDFAFGFDDIGSNGNPCEEDYRGPFAFSEPATKKMKNFLELTDEGRLVRIALNMHAYGNLMVHPFNYLNKDFDLKNVLNLSDDELIEILSETMCSTYLDESLYFY